MSPIFLNYLLDFLLLILLIPIANAGGISVINMLAIPVATCTGPAAIEQLPPVPLGSIDVGVGVGVGAGDAVGVGVGVGGTGVGVGVG